MSSPPVPAPDTKDWTWVIRRPCPDCGFDPATVDRADVPELTRRYVATLRTAATRPSACARPHPTTWSAIEYGCHVRDVCDLFAARLHRMLTEDGPLFDNWDQDATAVEERYWEQEPGELAEQLTVNAEQIAEAFGGVAGEQWQRPGRRSDGSEFTVDTFARYFLHDLAHHAWDVTGQRRPAG